MKNTHYKKKQSVRNVWAKFEPDRLSRFGTAARQVFTTQKTLPGEIPLAMKTSTSDSL